MEDMAREVRALRARVRLQTLALVGACITTLFALGGADLTANAAVGAMQDVYPFKIRTKNQSGTLTDRVSVSTDVTTAKVKLADAVLDLGTVTSGNLPSSPGAGTLWYDSTAAKVKYFNGSSWVEPGAPTLEVDSWRLVYTSATSLTLEGVGNGGGSIAINGTSYAWTTNPTRSNSGLSASTAYRIYAYSNAGTVTLEASTTAASKEEYGVYAAKTGDSTRRLVGLVYTNGSSQFTSDMVRSSMNEMGYALHLKSSHLGTVSTSSNSMVDIHSSLVAYGLFFNKERVDLWVRASISPDQTKDDCTIGVYFDSGDIADSYAGAYYNPPSTGTKNSAPTMHGRAFATTSSSGRKVVKGRFRNNGHPFNDSVTLYSHDYYPAVVGFQAVK